MRSSTAASLTVLLAATIVTWTSEQASAQVPAYTLTELPAPAGYHAPQVTGINPTGTIVTGTALLDGANTKAAVAWIEGEGIVIVDPGTWWGGMAKAANDAGVVVGWVNSSAFAWSDGDMTSLAGGHALPEAVNNTGTVAGTVGAGTANPRAARWIAGQHEILVPLYSFALGINDNGAIVGRLKDGSTWHAFLWQEGQWNTLPGPSGGNSTAVAINAAGVIAGYRQSYLPFPVKWEGGEMTYLTDGTTFGWAHDLNDSSDIVGTIFQQMGQPSLAAIWKGGSPDDLHLLNNVVANLPSGWSLETAVAISNTGHIIGTAGIGNEEHPFLLTPAKLGDLNSDGAVDVSDLLMLLANWGSCPRTGDCPGDINGDGVVDVTDLLILLANWG